MPPARLLLANCRTSRRASLPTHAGMGPASRLAPATCSRLSFARLPKDVGMPPESPVRTKTSTSSSVSEPIHGGTSPSSWLPPSDSPLSLVRLASAGGTAPTSALPRRSRRRRPWSAPRLAGISPCRSSLAKRSSTMRPAETPTPVHSSSARSRSQFSAPFGSSVAFAASSVVQSCASPGAAESSHRASGPLAADAWSATIAPATTAGAHLGWLHFTVVRSSWSGELEV